MPWRFCGESLKLARLVALHELVARIIASKSVFVIQDFVVGGKVSGCIAAHLSLRALGLDVTCSDMRVRNFRKVRSPRLDRVVHR